MEYLVGSRASRASRSSRTTRTSSRTTRTSSQESPSLARSFRLRAAVDAVKTSNTLGGEKARRQNGLRQFLEKRRVAMLSRKDTWSLGWNGNAPLPAGMGLPPPKQRQSSVDIDDDADSHADAPDYSSPYDSGGHTRHSSDGGLTVEPSPIHRSATFSWFGRSSRASRSADPPADQQRLSAFGSSTSGVSTDGAAAFQPYDRHADRARIDAAEKARRRQRFDRALDKAEHSNRGEAANGWTGRRSWTSRAAGSSDARSLFSPRHATPARGRDASATLRDSGRVSSGGHVDDETNASTRWEDGGDSEGGEEEGTPPRSPAAVRPLRRAFTLATTASA